MLDEELLFPQRAQPQHNDSSSASTASTIPTQQSIEEWLQKVSHPRFTPANASIKKTSKELPTDDPKKCSILIEWI